MKKSYKNVIRVVEAFSYKDRNQYARDMDYISLNRTVNGKKIYVNIYEWDGNVAGVMRAIYDACGYMENHLYHEVKASLENIRSVCVKSHLSTLSTPVEVPGIKSVIFHKPATIVHWEDGSKTVVICQEGDIYDEEKGLAMAIAKKALGNNYAAGGRFKKAFKNAVRRKNK